MSTMLPCSDLPAGTVPPLRIIRAYSNGVLAADMRDRVLWLEFNHPDVPMQLLLEHPVVQHHQQSSYFELAGALVPEPVPAPAPLPQLAPAPLPQLAPAPLPQLAPAPLPPLPAAPAPPPAQPYEFNPQPAEHFLPLHEMYQNAYEHAQLPAMEHGAQAQVAAAAIPQANAAVAAAEPAPAPVVEAQADANRRRDPNFRAAQSLSGPPPQAFLDRLEYLHGRFVRNDKLSTEGLLYIKTQWLRLTNLRGQLRCYVCNSSVSSNPSRHALVRTHRQRIAEALQIPLNGVPDTFTPIKCPNTPCRNAFRDEENLQLHLVHCQHPQPVAPAAPDAPAAPAAPVTATAPATAVTPVAAVTPVTDAAPDAVPSPAAAPIEHAPAENEERPCKRARLETTPSAEEVRAASLTVTQSGSSASPTPAIPDLFTPVVDGDSARTTPDGIIELPAKLECFSPEPEVPLKGNSEGNVKGEADHEDDDDDAEGETDHEDDEDAEGETDHEDDEDAEGETDREEDEDAEGEDGAEHLQVAAADAEAYAEGGEEDDGLTSWERAALRVVALFGDA